MRAYLPDLIRRILAREINPGAVFDPVLLLEQAVEAYRVMDERRAIKVLLPTVKRPEIRPAENERGLVMARFEVRTDVMVPMRDGVGLATDVYLPEVLPAPVLLTRTPYDKFRVAAFSSDLDLFRCLRAGYAVVVQDVRGRFGSEGEFVPNAQESADGADAVAWVAAQEWCDGNVGMFGKSYLGVTQWQAAVAAPPALRAFAASMTPAGVYEGNTHHGGVPTLHALRWAAGLSSAAAAKRVAAGDPVPTEWAPDFDPDGVLHHLPLADHPAYAELASFWPQWLAHPEDGPFWQEQSASSRYAEVQAPALNIAGWYDILLGPVIDNFLGTRPVADGAGQLIIGPWTHNDLSGAYPERDFGPAANSAGAFDLDGRQLAWFDHWLRGLNNGAETEPAVTYFLMGADQWRTADTWPPPGVQPTSWYLHSDGAANTRSGDGTLSLVPPAPEPTDSFTADPLDPVPTVGGQVLLAGPLGNGPRDQGAVEDREDVLVYTSAVLEDPVEVTGPVTATVWVSASTPDADLTVTLVDVHPDGRAILLTDGIRRLRYRHSTHTPELLEPGVAYEVTIDAWATANLFLPGHRIRLEIAGSSFPKYGRNSHTGGHIATEPPAAHVPSTLHVLHDTDHPSRLDLHVR